MIAGDESATPGPIHFALRYGGFEIRDAATPDDAARILAEHGCASCVLTIEARKLSAGRGGADWAGLLAEHAALSAVVTSRAPADAAARAATGAANRVLLENPFDAAAVVAGVRRAVAQPAAPAAKPLARVRRPKGGAQPQTTKRAARS